MEHVEGELGASSLTEVRHVEIQRALWHHHHVHSIGFLVVGFNWEAGFVELLLAWNRTNNTLHDGKTVSGTGSWYFAVLANNGEAERVELEIEGVSSSGLTDCCEGFVNHSGWIWLNINNNPSATVREVVFYLTVKAESSSQNFGLVL